MKIVIEAFLQDLKACSSCGADSYLFEIRAGSFCPIVGVCLWCLHAWLIVRTSHADQRFQRLKKYVVDGQLEDK